MPPQLPKNKAYNYAERIRARLPGRLQRARVAAGLSRYGLEQRCGILREMIGALRR